LALLQREGTVVTSVPYHVSRQDRRDALGRVQAEEAAADEEAAAEEAAAEASSPNGDTPGGSPQPPVERSTKR
jgi:hypothetical protein